MMRIQKGLLFITSGCVICIIAFWAAYNKPDYYSLILYNICGREYFQQCIRSKTSWIRCIEYLDMMSSEMNAFSYKYSSGWPPYSLLNLIDKRLPAFSLALKYIPFVKNANISTDDVLTYGTWQNYELNDTDYSIYPQNLNFSKLISSIEDGIPIQTKPVNNPEMFALRLPKNICNPYKNEVIPDLIVLVKSCIYDISKRDRARQTFMQNNLWPNFNVQFVFVLGLPMENESNIFKFDGFTNALETNWWSLSKQYADSKWPYLKKLETEANLHEDLLIGSFHDTYYNLTKKLIFTYRWLSAFCSKQVPLYIFMDDDYDLVPRNVIQFYRNYTKAYLRNMTGGYIRPCLTVFRPLVNETSSVWAMSIKEFPWETYPPYYYGLTYLLGASVVKHLAIGSAFIKEIRIDDAYLGILFNKLNIKPTHLNIISCDTSKSDILSGVINVHYKTSGQLMNWTSGMPK